MRIANLTLLGLYLICAWDKLNAQAGDTVDASKSAKAAEPVEWRREKRCGVNCLYVLLRMQGKSVTYDKLCEETMVSERGTSMAELARVGRLFGVELVAMQGTSVSLKQIPLPAIVHQQSPEDFMGHYVLLVGRDEKSYYILDCTTGRMGPITEGEFYPKWSGYVLTRREPMELLSFHELSYIWLGAGLLVFGVGVWKWRWR